MNGSRDEHWKKTLLEQVFSLSSRLDPVGLIHSDADHLDSSFVQMDLLSRVVDEG